jgi:predicted  nucleic acid-binding Zn-ribbon protein
MSIDLPIDQDGMLARECISENCSPGYFKIRPGTGIIEGYDKAFCPYCRSSGDPNDFATRGQIEYAKSIAVREAQKGMDRIVRKTFGIGPSGKKKIGGGLISMEMTYKPSTPRPIQRPYEEELRRDVICPKCGLDHAVFGLASWCPDCGVDIFLSHVAKEFEVIEMVIAALDERRSQLGQKIAGRDIENALEDAVSIFEAVLKAITKRHLVTSGVSDEDAQQILEKEVRNRYQSVQSATKTFEKHVGFPLMEGASNDDIQALEVAFEKRHPITHNLGIVDRKYLERAMSGELEGRDIRLSAEEVLRAARIAHSVIVRTYNRAFPDSQSDAVGD